MARCLALVLALAALALVAQPALAATRYEVLYLGNDNCTGVPDTIVSQPGKKQCTVDWETNCETLGKAGTDTYAAYCLNETLASSALVMPVYLLPTTVAMTAEYASANCTGNVTIASGNRVAHCISYGAGEDVDDQDGGSGMFKCDENDMPFVVQVCVVCGWEDVPVWGACARTRRPGGRAFACICPSYAPAAALLRRRGRVARVWGREGSLIAPARGAPTQHTH